MRLVLPLSILIVGVVLLIFGLNASQSLSSGLSETFSGAPSNKSLLLILLGVVCLLYGGVGTIFNRK